MSGASLAARPSTGVLADRLLPRRSALVDVAVVVTGAAVVALLAQASWRIGPVPLTGQTLGVMLVGGALGMRRGAAALTTYLLAGFTLATVAPFVVGVPYLAAVLGLTDLAAIAAIGITPFIVPGLVKAGIAAALFPLAWRAIRALDVRR